MEIYLHQTNHIIADLENIFLYLKKYFQKNSSGLHIFPELFLTGYPLQDLCLQTSFIKAYHTFLNAINHWSQKELLPSSEHLAILLGGLNYSLDEKGVPIRIENVIYSLLPGQKLKIEYVKQLLPYYDIFDEKKYFSKGTTSRIWQFNNYNIGLLLCEDMWPTAIEKINPIDKLLQLSKTIKAPLDLIVNLSASPFHLGKSEKRIKQAQNISQYLQAPFAYVNRVGAEDEILFDGGSFVVERNNIKGQASYFAEDILTINIPDKTKKPSSKLNNIPLSATSWEDLFEPRLQLHPKDKKALGILKLNDEDCAQIIQALIFGIQQYAQKCHFNNFVVAVSGGLDSSVVLALAALGLKKNQKLSALYMPGHYSSPLSSDLALQLCKRLNIQLTTVPINTAHNLLGDTLKKVFTTDLNQLTNENLQSRIRGLLIYTYSNQTKSLVLNTSNKSELAVGYSTLYGDSVGAISALGDLYKTEIYQLANYINRQYDNIFPEQLLNRPPTAELSEGQLDQDKLPPYEHLDAILEGILSYRMNSEDLINSGFQDNEIKLALDLIHQSEYKRSQFCPIIKVKQKSFGFGYRVPICKKNLP